jgi:hypothetical protein
MPASKVYTFRPGGGDDLSRGEKTVFRKRNFGYEHFADMLPSRSDVRISE